MLLPTLLDGLIWRSHRPEGGMRRVNFFVYHMLVTESGEYADALKWLAATGDPGIIAHPVANMMSDTLWNGVVYRQFVVYKMWNILSLAVFMLSQGILPRMITVDITPETKRNYLIAIACGRLFTYSLGMGRLAGFHLSRIWTWCRSTLKRIFEQIDTYMEAMVLFKKEIGNVWRSLVSPDEDASKKANANESSNMYNIISFVLMVILVVMLTHEPILWCINEAEIPTDDCPGATDGIKYRYSIMACLSLIIHWIMIVDLAVFSTEISAFLLVCGHVVDEVKTFMAGLTFLLLMFGSAFPIFCSTAAGNCPPVAGNFSNMPHAILSLFAITLGWFEADYVMNVRETDQMFLAVLFLFVGLSVILLLNLLIAQLNRSYEYIYQDMIGFAKLNRASLIVEAMVSCSKAKWERFRDSLHFERKLEFDPGDLGLAGAIQSYEPQAVCSVLEETIKRFGGSTSVDMPWPQEKSNTEDQEERFDRLELLLQKALSRMSTQKGKARDKGGSAGQMGSGSGTLQSSGSGSFEMPRQASGMSRQASI